MTFIKIYLGEIAKHIKLEFEFIKNKNSVFLSQTQFPWLKRKQGHHITRYSYNILP